MSRLKTQIDRWILKRLGIYQAATMDGYWGDKAAADIQYVYLLGQLHATKSIHSSWANNSTKLRIKRLKQEINDLGVELFEVDRS